MSKKLVCALCLRPVTPETSVFSQHRRVHYCAPPWFKCDRERKRLEKLVGEKAA